MISTDKQSASGYKRTELGEIPEDWEIRTLSGMSASNGLVRGPFGGSLKKSDFVKEGIKVYEQRNAIYETTELGRYFITKPKFDELKRFEVSGGDFIVSCSGTIGKIYKIPDKHPKGIINQALLKITINESIVPNYFEHYFKWEPFQEKIIDGTQGGAMKNLVGMAEFKHSLMAVPKHIQEQTAIANALSDVDSLLTELEKLITKKQAIKTATMQQLLTGKTRLPQFARYTEGEKQGQLKGMKDSELGEIPEDWEVKTYGEIFSFQTTASNSRSDLTSEGDIGYIHYGDIHTKWNYLLDISKTTLPHISNEKVTSAAFLKNGDIVMADASEDYEGIGKSIEITGSGRKKVISGLHTFLLRDKSEVFSDGFRGYLHSIMVVKSTFDRLATGLKVYGLSKSNLKIVPLPIPPKQEQTAIANILSDMDEEIKALEQRLSKTRHIKQGMMQELLTGRTRLPFNQES
ncbi:MAG: restriction endonuclease subunit S [Alteromonadaceae bacterium]|nr:restriction endonuclease subunit S [Alteromonadaceae bacterium]